MPAEEKKKDTEAKWRRWRLVCQEDKEQNTCTNRPSYGLQTCARKVGGWWPVCAPSAQPQPRPNPSPVQRRECEGKLFCKGRVARWLACRLADSTVVRWNFGERCYFQNGGLSLVSFVLPNHTTRVSQTSTHRPENLIVTEFTLPSKNNKWKLLNLAIPSQGPLNSESIMFLE